MRLTEKEILRAVLDETISVKEARILYEDWYSKIDRNYAKSLAHRAKDVLKNKPLMAEIRSFFETPKGRKAFNLGVAADRIASELSKNSTYRYGEILDAVNAYYAEVKGTGRNPDSDPSYQSLKGPVISWLNAHKENFIGGGVGIEGSEDIALAYLESDEGQEVDSDEYEAITAIVRGELAKLRKSGQWSRN